MRGDARCRWRPHDAGRPLANNARRYRLAAAMSAPPRSARLPAWPAHARRPLLFRLRACSCIWSSRESDDLASGSRSASTASVACGRRTWNVLAGLVGDELVEVDVGDHAAL